jgi:hypothetical protein
VATKNKLSEAELVKHSLLAITLLTALSLTTVRAGAMDAQEEVAQGLYHLVYGTHAW